MARTSCPQRCLPRFDFLPSHQQRTQVKAGVTPHDAPASHILASFRYKIRATLLDSPSHQFSILPLYQLSYPLSAQHPLLYIHRPPQVVPAMASHQPPVSPFKALGLGLAAGWVGILATLDVYSTASHSAQALPDHVELRNLPQSFSFAALLSPSTPGQLATVTYGKQPLHSSYLVCLALNEECRAMKRGGFYYLPVQDRPASRPCDLVFVDESWGARSIKTWDESKWGERLTMFPACKSFRTLMMISQMLIDS